MKTQTFYKGTVMACMVRLHDFFPFQIFFFTEYGFILILLQYFNIYFRLHLNLETMENLRIRDFLPLKMSAVQRIFHQDLCKSYSQISKIRWVPKQGDYFYRIARNIIGLYKKNNRQRGVLLEHEYLNKVIHPNKQYQEGEKPSQERQASIKNHCNDNVSDNDNSNSKSNGELSKSDANGRSKNDDGNIDLSRRPKRTQALKPKDMMNLGVYTTKTPCLAIEKEKPQRKRRKIERTQCISCRRYFDHIEVHLMKVSYD